MEDLEVKFAALSVARRLQPSEPTYLLDLAVQMGGTGDGLVAVCCSNRSVLLHSSHTLSLQREYKGHSEAVFGVRFAHTSPSLLYSGSADGTLHAWDVRSPGSQAAQVFQSASSHPLCSFDISCNDMVLCAGTEQVEEDSFLMFWDTRLAKAKESGGVLGVYSESHSDDITQVRFHPRDPDRLASGSTDGLVNVFDLSQGSEEDALRTTCNSSSSVSVVCWAGKEHDRLLCFSHDEGLYLWDLGHVDTEEPLTILSVPDARSSISLPRGGALDYFVGGTWVEEAERLLVLGGTSRGELHLFDCRDQGLELLKSLQGGHSATVRCFQWDPAGGALFTGGEDAQLLQWKPGAEEHTSGKRCTLKSASALQLKARVHGKHRSKREK